MAEEELVPICHRHLEEIMQWRKVAIGNHGSLNGSSYLTYSSVLGANGSDLTTIAPLAGRTEGSGSGDSTLLTFMDDHHEDESGAAAAAPGWFQVLLPIVCALGIGGNILNLIVLTRKRFCATMGKLERTSNIGLTALAVSDMLFCVAVFPYSFLQSANYGGQAVTLNPPLTSATDVFFLYYAVYGISAINLFLMTSTWLIVALAVERYIVLYYPLKAKCILSEKRSRITVCLIYFFSIVLTLPYFCNFEVRMCEGFDRGMKLERIPRWAEGSPWARVLKIYIPHVWPVLAVFFPLALLLFCNWRLVQGLRKVPTTRRLTCPGQTVRDVNTRITLTLVIIVAMALAFVTPAEIIKIINPYKLWRQHGHLVAAVANLMQSLSFALNFVLYCCIDRHFRLICRLTLLGNCASSDSLSQMKEVVVLYRQGTGSSVLLY